MISKLPSAEAANSMNSIAEKSRRDARLPHWLTSQLRGAHLRPAEILLRYQPQLAQILDVQKCLEALVQQAAPGEQLTYADYMHEFIDDGPRFYPRLRERSSGFWCHLLKRVM